MLFSIAEDRLVFDDNEEKPQLVNCDLITFILSNMDDTSYFSATYCTGCSIIIVTTVLFVHMFT